jgi:hypothetical protein
LFSSLEFLRQISLRITRWPSQFTTPRTSEESNTTFLDATNDHDAKPRFRLSASTKSGLSVMIV